MKKLLAVLVMVLASVQPAFAQLRDDDGDLDTPAIVAGTDVYMFLEQLSLSVDDMPDDFQMAENGWLDFFDLAHPLNALLLSNLDMCPAPNSARYRYCQFRTRYVLGVSGFSIKAKTFIGNYLYSFST